MCKLKVLLGMLLVPSAFLFVSARSAAAQSTLFNIPSTDVVAEGRTYLEFDFITHPESHERGGFQTYGVRAVFDVRKGVEAGVNVTTTDALLPNQPVEIQPNAKWQFYQNESKGVAAAAGGILYVPATDRGATDTFGMVYSTVSKKVRAKYGPRVTGGAYTLLNRKSGNGSTTGAIVGYEQPVLRRASFVADWMSGNNRFGYLTPGVAVTISKQSSLYAGYSIGNRGRKNNALFLYYAITF